MSHFYGGVQGGRGEATRTGHKTTGIHAYIKTWDTSMWVRLHYDDEDGKNYYTVMGMTFPEEDYDTMCAIFQAGAVSYYKAKVVAE